MNRSRALRIILWGLCPLLLEWSCEAAVERPHVLFIAIDDLRNDVAALGCEHARTPALDKFAGTARIFNHHYVQVPTCGASRCALMRGRYPSVASQLGNNGIRQTHGDWGKESLPVVFRQHGYRTLALGKITHYPGGLTGKDWAEGPEELPGAWDRCWIPDCPWKSPQALMHGYANGQPRVPGMSPPWEAAEGTDDAYPDAWVAREAIRTLQELTQQEQPWFFSVGFFKPHLPFAAPRKWHDLHAEGIPALAPLVARKPNWPSGWHASGEFRGNYGHPQGQDPETDEAYAGRLRRAYAACISYMDAQLGQVLEALDQSGVGPKTIVIIWSDHGFLLGEHAIWGKHCLYEQALRSPLMIRTPGLQHPGETCAATVETIDLFPTLVDLCELTAPASLDGLSLRPYLVDPAKPSLKPARGFWTGGRQTVRDDRWRLIVHPASRKSGAYVELFDYRNDPEETRNHAADLPEVVSRLQAQLRAAP